MEQSASRAGKLELIGGKICLDFVNTADWHSSPEPVEILNTYEELLHWCRHAGLLGDSDTEKLRNEALSHPIQAEKVLTRAIMVRETLFRIFYSLAGRGSPDPADLTAFNDDLRQALSRAILREKGDGYSLEVTEERNSLDWFLNTIIWEATRLLTSDEIKRIKKCSDSRCGWLFLDTSKNQSRRWCSMQDCGNRAKATRFYKRKKQSS